MRTQKRQEKVARREVVRGVERDAKKDKTRERLWVFGKGALQLLRSLVLIAMTPGFSIPNTCRVNSIGGSSTR
jgi:hypothetical protein